MLLAKSDDGSVKLAGMLSLGSARPISIRIRKLALSGLRYAATVVISPDVVIGLILKLHLIIRPSAQYRRALRLHSIHAAITL